MLGCVKAETGVGGGDGSARFGVEEVARPREGRDERQCTSLRGRHVVWKKLLGCVEAETGKGFGKWKKLLGHVKTET